MAGEDSLNRGLTWDPQRDRRSEHVLLEFKLTTSADRSETAYLFARLLSTSCAVRLHGESDEIRRRRAAKVLKVTGESVVLAFPIANFTGQLVDLLLAAYVDLNSEIYSTLELTSLELPRSVIDKLESPPYGQRLLEVYARPGRPLLVGVVKPSQGLSPSAHVDLALEAFRGGCDVAKDDENLLPDDAENPLLERVSRLMPRIRALRKELRRPFLYVANVHSDTEAERYCRYLASLGDDDPPLFGALVSPILGLPYLRRIRRASAIPLFCHSTGIGLFVSGAFRVSRSAYVKLLRLTGMDAMINAPPFAEGWQCSPVVAVQLLSACGESADGAPGMLLVFGGGLGPKNYEPIRRLLGTNRYGYLVGGSIFAHPRGAEMGARTLVGSIEEVESRY